MRFLIPLLLLSVSLAAAPPLHVYVGDLGPRHALIAWGYTQGEGNTIGRGAQSAGKAVLRVGDRSVETERAWALVEGLQPDREYEYSLRLNGQEAATGRIRTWPEHTNRAAFLVFGDWGNGSADQNRIAEAMSRVVEEKARSANPIRFVLSTGDNIYSVVPGVILAGSGDKDSHWGPRFFDPYRSILRSTPFYVVLGNHDGNESERRGDLALQLDNFFYPGNRPARWYRFSFADLLDVVMLDTTRNTEKGRKRPVWEEDGEQFRWAREEFAKLRAPWRIAVHHHPMFNAGPRHQKEENEVRMKHLLDLFGRSGIQAVFNGHEHNFQTSERNERSRNIRFFVSGAGGELRDDDVTRHMQSHNIAGWAPQNHFLLVEIEDNRMKVTPMGAEPVKVRTPGNGEMPLPVVVSRESEKAVR